jgi:hypothetical protein
MYCIEFLKRQRHSYVFYRFFILLAVGSYPVEISQVKNVTGQCSIGLNNIRNSANDALLNVSSVNIFFVCSMLKNSHSPTTISQSVPGDIEMNGILTALGRTVPVQEYRNAFIQSRLTVVSCGYVEFNASSFCDNHLSSVLTDSKWYK